MWNPFSKQNYAKQKLLSTQEAQEFDRQRSHMLQLEKTCKKILHDSKEYGNALQALNKCEIRIPQNLVVAGFVAGTSLQKLGDSWQKAASDVEKLRMENLNVFNQVLTEPIKKYTAAFPAWQNGLKRWENHAQDCSKEQAKAEKFKEREQTPLNRSKFEQHQKAHEYAKEEFYEWHNQFSKDTAQFMNDRGEYLAPSVEALVESQMDESQQLERLFSSLCIEVQADWAGSDQVYKTQMQNKIQELKGLTIVATDKGN